MKKLNSLLLILSVMFLSCDDYRPNDQIEDLIRKNEEYRVFLGFFTGMSPTEFKRVMKFENSKGNLVDNRFILETTFKIPFEIINHGNRIELKYEDEVLTDFDGYSPSGVVALFGGNSSANSYKNIVDYLENYYDSKYSRIMINDRLGRLAWKDTSSQSNCRVIVLKRHSIYGQNKSNGSTVITRVKKVGKSEKVVLASCDISIDYYTCKSFNEANSRIIQDEKEQDRLKNEKLKQKVKQNNKL